MESLPLFGADLQDFHNEIEVEGDTSVESLSSWTLQCPGASVNASISTYPCRPSSPSALLFDDGPLVCPASSAFDGHAVNATPTMAIPLAAIVMATTSPSLAASSLSLASSSLATSTSTPLHDTTFNTTTMMAPSLTRVHGSNDSNHGSSHSVPTSPTLPMPSSVSFPSVTTTSTSVAIPQFQSLAMTSSGTAASTNRTTSPTRLSACAVCHAHKVKCSGQRPCER
jgi:cytochrome c553